MNSQLSAQLLFIHNREMLIIANEETRDNKSRRIYVSFACPKGIACAPFTASIVLVERRIAAHTQRREK
jgi:hypothetical protein